MALSQAQALERLTNLIEGNAALTDLPWDKKVELAHKADLHLYRQGEVLTRQGDQADSFFVVISGEVVAFDETRTPRRVLNYHPPGSIVGLRAILDQTWIRQATLEAQYDSVIAIFTEEDFNWLLRQDPQLEYKIREMEKAFTERAISEFPGQQHDEVVLAATKRHILAFVATLVWPIVLLIVPVVFLLIIEIFAQNLAQSIRQNPWLYVVVIGLSVFFSALIILYNYLDWRNDDLIVTTKRVIHIERILFYSEVRDEAPLTQIQNIVFTSQGWFDALFDIDDIKIQTAALGDIFVDRIPAAQDLVQVMLVAQQRAKERVAASDQERVRNLLTERLSRSLMESPVTDQTTPVRHASRRFSFSKLRLPRFGLGYFVPRVRQISTERGEQVITWRKHYIVLLVHALWPLLFLFVFGYLFIGSFFNWWPFAQYSLVSSGWHWLLGIALSITLFWYSWAYDTWRRDVYMVTGTKIVDKEGTAFGLRGEKVREGSFDSIQNIHYDIPNLPSRLLNLGNVTIKTAGTFGDFSFKKVFNPSAIQEEVFRRWDVYQQRNREKRRDDVTRQVVGILGEYHDVVEATDQL